MTLAINVLGEFQVTRDGQPVKFPASKRTRALLAYLALTNRPHRRDRLCEIFWDMTDDPRGSLRWSLSKLRPLLNTAESECLQTDRERVNLTSELYRLDLTPIRNALNCENSELTTLISFAEQLNQPLLPGLDLPDQEFYQRWLTAEREECQQLRAQLCARLTEHSDLSRVQRLQWAEAWMEADPYSTDGATHHVSLLEKLQSGNAEAQLQFYKNRFQKAGINWSSDARSELSESGSAAKIDHRQLLANQKIQFCTARDGARIAYASVGPETGTPIIKAANWLSHLEYDWEAPIWSPLFRDLAQDHPFFRYDERGNGLSDWTVEDISFDSFVTDLETVVDASGHERFALLGISQGAAVSIEYAVRYPHRVSHLILFGGYASGWRIDADEHTAREREAVMTLTATGWGQDNPAYRQIFSTTFMPSASSEELSWFNEFQRITTSPENAVRFLSVFADIDVREQLKKVTVPTLVIHSMGDQRIPVEIGQEIAKTIPNASFLGLESDGHLLLGREQASQQFVDAVREFLATPKTKNRAD